MDDNASRSTPIRQFRVTLTEDRDGNVTTVHLSWRAFPCAATKWDGTAVYEIPASYVAPVTSVDALRGLLADVAVSEWKMRRGAR